MYLIAALLAGLAVSNYRAYVAEFSHASALVRKSASKEASRYLQEFIERQGRNDILSTILLVIAFTLAGLKWLIGWGP
jgi:hypothetical protein